MKKNNFFSIFLILAVLGGLTLLSGCEVTESGEGTTREGTIILMNNSANVIIVYWTVERSGNTVEESHTRINPGASTTVMINSGFYTIYLEDHYGDGWETKSSVYVGRDKTIEVKFPSDFKVSN